MTRSLADAARRPRRSANERSLQRMALGFGVGSALSALALSVGLLLLWPGREPAHGATP